jgi:hypothetical protein
MRPRRARAPIPASPRRLQATSSATDSKTTVQSARPSQSSRAPDTRRAPAIEAYFGATGTGKSTSIKRRVPELGVPVLIFDPKHEYLRDRAGDCSERAFIAACNAMAPGAHAPAHWAILRPSFAPELLARQFSRFCVVALAVARARGRCVVVVDELHLLTDASGGGAPSSWLELVRIGRAFGVHILAGSIRPQSIDMDVRTNLTYVRSGRLGEESDCRRVASKLMIDWRELAALPNLEFFERDLLAGTPARRGRLTF